MNPQGIGEMVGEMRVRNHSIFWSPEGAVRDLTSIAPRSLVVINPIYLQ